MSTTSDVSNRSKPTKSKLNRTDIFFTNRAVASYWGHHWGRKMACSLRGTGKWCTRKHSGSTANNHPEIAGCVASKPTLGRRSGDAACASSAGPDPDGRGFLPRRLRRRCSVFTQHSVVLSGSLGRELLETDFCGVPNASSSTSAESSDILRLRFIGDGKSVGTPNVAANYKQSRGKQARF